LLPGTRMFSIRTALAIACLAIATAIPQSSAHAQERANQDRPRIERISFEGADELETGELRRAIATEETRCRSFLFRPFCWLTDWDVFVRKEYLDPDQLARDDLRLRVRYFQRGYRDAAVGSDLRPRGRGVEIVFRIDEGAPTVIDSLHVEAPEDRITDAQLRRARLPRADEPLDLIRLDSARVLIDQMLENRGFLDARVEDSIEVRTDGRTAFVALTVMPGPRATLERIEVEGNDRVDESTITSATVLREGGVLRRRDMESARRSLYESNLFHQATISVSPEGDSAKTLRIEVREAPPRSARIEAGFNTLDFVQTAGRFVHYNWLGAGRRLDVNLTVGNLLARQLNDRGIFRDVLASELGIDDESAFLRPTWQAGVDLMQPAFRAAENTVGGGIFAHRQTVPGIAIDNGYGANLSFTRRVEYRTSASLIYRFESTGVEAGDLYFCVNFGVCDPGTITALQARHQLSPLGLSFTSEQTDSPLARRDGWRARVSLEHASGLTASDFHFHRISGAASRYFALDRGRQVLAARLRLGWVRPLGSTAAAVGIEPDPNGTVDQLLHPRKRFYAGGSTSVRGYGENQLGPRILTVSPEVLTDQELENACTLAEIEAGTCDPNFAPVGDFLPRPLGGNSVLEANLEYRFPLWRQIGAAAFLDGAIVRGRGDGALGGGVAAMTPGFGLRYESPVGPIRVDLGIRPTLVEELPVVTEFIDEAGVRQLITLETPRRYDPLEDSGGTIRQVLNRLTLHLSIGEAF
jgi:outer membrane protein insertion porin family